MRILILAIAVASAAWGQDNLSARVSGKVVNIVGVGVSGVVEARFESIYFD